MRYAVLSMTIAEVDSGAGFARSARSGADGLRAWIGVRCANGGAGAGSGEDSASEGAPSTPYGVRCTREREWVRSLECAFSLRLVLDRGRLLVLT